MGGRNNKRQRSTWPDRDGQLVIEGITSALPKMYAALNCRAPSSPTRPFTDERTEAHELLRPHSDFAAIQFRSLPSQKPQLSPSLSIHVLEELKLLKNHSDSCDISPLLLPLPSPVPDIAVW